MDRQEKQKTCDHMEQVCERLCHTPRDLEILVGYDVSALDTILDAMARGEKYRVSYPFLKEGEVHRVWESRVCDVRFWLVAGEGQFAVHELSTYCQSPEPVIEEFMEMENAHFVITGWTDGVWEDPCSKNEDLVEVNCGRAWRKLPLANLKDEWETIAAVVDDVARRTITACWEPAPDGAKFIADCAAHYKWKMEPQVDMGIEPATSTKH